MSREQEIDALLCDPAPPLGGHLTRFELEHLAAAHTGAEGTRTNLGTRDHLSSCSQCQIQHREIEEERQRFLARAPATTLHLSIRASHPTRFAPALVAVVASLAAAALLYIPSTREERTKGPASMRVFVLRDERAFVAESGEGFLSGDALRIEVSARPPAYVWVFLQSGGDLVSYYSNEQLTHSPAVLDGSLELDAEARAEWLIVLVSESMLEESRAENIARGVALEKSVQRIVFEVTRKATNSGSRVDEHEAHGEYR